MAVRAVVSDFGYTRADADRVWHEVSAAVGVTVANLYAAIGAAVERRQRHRAVLDLLGVEPAAPVDFEPRDLYGDAVPALRAVKASGRAVGVAGNTSAAVDDFLRENVEADSVGSSGRWGVAKPAPGFLARIADDAGCEPHEILDVGDRLDNDVLPALAAGMQAVFLGRGPSATIRGSGPETRGARSATAHAEAGA